MGRSHQAAQEIPIGHPYRARIFALHSIRGDSCPNPIVGLHHCHSDCFRPAAESRLLHRSAGASLGETHHQLDDPGTYHFYFGDDGGSPGTILTFFPWPHAARGSLGVGETSATAFSVPLASLAFWEKRLLSAGIPAERTGERFKEEVLSFADLDGMRLEIVGHACCGGRHRVPATFRPSTRIRGFFGVTLCEGATKERWPSSPHGLP